MPTLLGLTMGCRNNNPACTVTSRTNLVEQIALLEPWRVDGEYSQEGWKKMVRLARVIQRAAPADVSTALEAFAESRAFTVHRDYEEDSRPFILLRIVFQLPEANPTNSLPRGFKGWRYSSTNSAPPPSWPVGWRNGKPHLVCGWPGSSGRGYGAVAEYEYFLKTYPYRDLATLRSMYHLDGSE